MTKKETNTLACWLMRRGIDPHAACELARIAASYQHPVSIEVK